MSKTVESSDYAISSKLLLVTMSRVKEGKLMRLLVTL